MRIAIVNDVMAIAESLKNIVTASNRHEVIWIAYNGKEAVEKCAADTPDLILMDLIMPVMDGVDATTQIMNKTPCAILIVTASVHGNANKVFGAMGAGALDVISTPTLNKDDREKNIQALHHKIDTIGKLVFRSKSTKKEIKVPVKPEEGSAIPLVAIGSSTGGPSALAKVLQKIPGDTRACFVIVQHVDSNFAESLASWLNDQTDLTVRVAKENDRPEAGVVLVAGTSDHLIMKKNGQVGYTPYPEDYVYRPSVDVFFSSATKYWGTTIIGVLLTGMGKDGAKGLLDIKNSKMLTIAQDKETCAVYGMPKAAAEINAATKVLPINDIGNAIMSGLRKLEKMSA
jgi:two-component system response regulator WspF